MNSCRDIKRDDVWWRRLRSYIAHSYIANSFQIFGWEPQFYNDTKNLPSTMPKDLVDHIKQEEHSNRLDTVWVSCSGENPADVENMGAIQYIPSRGFPGYYFPFKNTPGYLSPLVAVFFEKPKCTWWKNWKFVYMQTEGLTIYNHRLCALQTVYSSISSARHGRTTSSTTDSRGVARCTLSWWWIKSDRTGQSPDHHRYQPRPP